MAGWKEIKSGSEHTVQRRVLRLVPGSMLTLRNSHIYCLLLRNWDIHSQLPPLPICSSGNSGGVCCLLPHGLLPEWPFFFHSFPGAFQKIHCSMKSPYIHPHCVIFAPDVSQSWQGLGEAFLVLSKQHSSTCAWCADPPHLHEAGWIEIPVLLLRPYPFSKRHVCHNDVHRASPQREIANIPLNDV